MSIINQEFIKKNLYHRTLFSILLWPFSIIYSIIQIIRRFFYRSLSKPYRSRCRIISIGNIVSGGSGKTPFTIFLASFLRDRGSKVAVSHRGYKSTFERTEKLISNYKEVFSFAHFAGDEAYLLAKKMRGIPVVAGKNRKLCLILLEKEFPDLDIIIMDDSFQHLKVLHDLDFLVFNSHGGIGNGFVLPAGILREPFSACKYADCLVVNGDSKKIPEFGKYKLPVHYGSYKISELYNAEGKEINIKDINNTRNVLLSGIGLPDSFEALILENGLDFSYHFKFSDHFNYDDENIIIRIKKYVVQKDIDYVITTEKDFTKLKFLNIEGIPLIIVGIEYVPEDRVFEKLLSFHSNQLN